MYVYVLCVCVTHPHIRYLPVEEAEAEALRRLAGAGRLEMPTLPAEVRARVEEVRGAVGGTVYTHCRERTL